MKADDAAVWYCEVTTMSRSDRNIPKRKTTLAKGGGRVKQIETIREALKNKAAPKRAARIKDWTRDHVYNQLPDFPPVGLH